MNKHFISDNCLATPHAAAALSPTGELLDARDGPDADEDPSCLGQWTTHDNIARPFSKWCHTTSGFETCFCYRIQHHWCSGGPNQSTISNPE